MSNVKKFIELQDKANNDIDQFGQTTSETANELEAVGDALTYPEIDEVIAIYNQRKINLVD